MSRTGVLYHVCASKWKVLCGLLPGSLLTTYECWLLQFWAYVNICFLRTNSLISASAFWVHMPVSMLQSFSNFDLIVLDLRSKMHLTEVVAWALAPFGAYAVEFHIQAEMSLKVITAYGNLVMVVISIFFYFHFLFSILSVPVFVIYFSFHLSGSITFTQDTSGFVFRSKSVHWPVTLVGCY